MNPYKRFLGSARPLPVIESTPAKLRQIFANIEAEKSPAPGKWSPREILCHLADCEIAFAFRLRQALAETDHVIQPFDQDGWAAAYKAYDVPTALNTFDALRMWNLALIRSLQPEDWNRRLNHPERGEMTYEVLIETMAGHDLNHLFQLS
jgi:hypothetical protein